MLEQHNLSFFCQSSNIVYCPPNSLWQAFIFHDMQHTSTLQVFGKNVGNTLYDVL